MLINCESQTNVPLFVDDVCQTNIETAAFSVQTEIQSNISASTQTTGPNNHKFSQTFGPNLQNSGVQTDLTAINIEDKDTQINQLKELLSDLETEHLINNWNLNSDKEALTNQVINLQQQMATMQNTNSNLEQSLQTQQKEVLSLNDSIKKLDVNVASLSATNQELIQERTILHQQIQNNEKHIVHLKTKIENMEQSFIEMETVIPTIDDSLIEKLAKKQEALCMKNVEFDALDALPISIESPSIEDPYPLQFGHPNSQEVLLELEDVVSKVKELTLSQQLYQSQASIIIQLEKQLLQHSSLNNIISIENDNYFNHIYEELNELKEIEEYYDEAEYENFDSLFVLYEENYCDASIQTEATEAPVVLDSQAIDMLELREQISKLKMQCCQMEEFVSEKEVVIKEKEYEITQFKEIIDTKDIFMREYKSMLDGLHFMK